MITHSFLKDTAGPGTLLWLLGYLASMALYFTLLSGKMAWLTADVSSAE